MISRLLQHVRGNAIAYVALFFAIGGGGIGAATAATVIGSNSTIHACVSKKNGALYIDRRCSKTTRALSFNERGVPGATGATGPQGVAGTSGIVAFGEVGDNGSVGTEQGLTITPSSTGLWSVSVSPTVCAGTSVPVVSPLGEASTNGSLDGPPVVLSAPGGNANATFTVQAGNIENGDFVLTDQGFDVQVACDS